MSISNNKKPHISQMARPRGRRYQSISFSLTIEQIEYLDTIKNPSELIRGLLSRHMRQTSRAEEEDTLDSLKAKLEQVKHEKAVLEDEYDRWHDDHEEELYEDGYRHWKENGSLALKRGAHADKLIRTMRDYERRLKELDETVSNLEEAIAKAEQST